MLIDSRPLIYTAVISQLLFSFYIHSIGVAPFSLLSTVLFAFIGFFSFGKKNISLVLSRRIVFLLIAYIAVSIVWAFLLSYLLDHDVHVISIFGFYFNIFMLIGWLALCLKSKTRLSADLALRLFFLLSLFFIVMQILSWYILGVTIDYMVFFTGEEQRLFGHKMTIAGTTTQRVAGIFAEPALYCWIMIGLGYFLFDKKISELKKTIIVFVFLMSVFLTFSLSGIFLAIGVLCIKIFSSGEFSKKGVLLLILLAVLYAVYPFLESYLVTRIGDIENDGSFIDKYQAFSVVYGYLSDPIFSLMGLGLGAKIETPALNFILSSFFHFGLIGFSIICFLIIYTLFIIPGLFIDKFFIFFYVVILGNHVTQSLTWFLFGAMCLLMVNNRLNGSLGK
jgi:hypothetical protein